MDWHWTWQDPIALTLALTGLGLSIWAWRRGQNANPCSRCPIVRSDQAQQG